MFTACAGCSKTPVPARAERRFPISWRSWAMPAKKLNAMIWKHCSARFREPKTRQTKCLTVWSLTGVRLPNSPREQGDWLSMRPKISTNYWRTFQTLRYPRIGITSARKWGTTCWSRRRRRLVSWTRCAIGSWKPATPASSLLDRRILSGSWMQKSKVFFRGWKWKTFQQPILPTLG